MTPDPLGLRNREHFTAPGMGRIEKRSHPVKREATADAQRLADALSDFDATTDDTVTQAGRDLGWTTARTLGAIRSAMRLGLLEDWNE